MLPLLLLLLLLLYFWVELWLSWGCDNWISFITIILSYLPALFIIPSRILFFFLISLKETLIILNWPYLQIFFCAKLYPSSSESEYPFCRKFLVIRNVTLGSNKSQDLFWKILDIHTNISATQTIEQKIQQGWIYYFLVLIFYGII